jgi:hypothetical protein
MLSSIVNAGTLEKVEGTYKGSTVKKGKDCYLSASFQHSKWYRLEPYRTKRERKKLDKKSISFSSHKSVMLEEFENEYNIFLSSNASDVSAMYNWMIGREAKSHHLEIETNNDKIPTSYEFSSERSKMKRIYKCINLKKL